jgi:hypothetical protein
MKKLALGITTAAVLLSAVPAMAQVGFYAGQGGLGVQFGEPYRHYDYYDYSPGPYYDHYAAPDWRWHHGWRYRHWHHW